MDKEIILSIIDSLKVIGPSVILPIFILWLTNRNSRKQKEEEHEFELRKLEKSKELEIDANIELNKKKHHIVVHSGLVNILFDVQKLHIELSGNCEDISCIDDAIKNFQAKLSDQQSKIAEYQIFLSSLIVNNLYRFYSLIGELLVELKYIRENKLNELAGASVYNYSIKMAEVIISIQFDILSKRKKLNEEFNALELPYFKACCGKEPPESIRKEYEVKFKKKMSIVNELSALPDPIAIPLDEKVIASR